MRIEHLVGAALITWLLIVAVRRELRIRARLADLGRPLDPATGRAPGVVAAETVEMGGAGASSPGPASPGRKVNAVAPLRRMAYEPSARGVPDPLPWRRSTSDVPVATLVTRSGCRPVVSSFPLS